MIREIIDIDNFIVQQVGTIDSLGTVPPVPGGIVNPAFPLTHGVPYYLSATDLGEIDTANPANPNFSKPMLMPYNTAGGWIYPMKPTDTAGGAGGIGPVILGSFEFNGETEIEFSDVFDCDYPIVKIVGIDLQVAVAAQIYMRVESAGVFDTGYNYNNAVPVNGNIVAGGGVNPWMNVSRGYPNATLTGDNQAPANVLNKFKFSIDVIAPCTDQALKFWHIESEGLYQNAPYFYTSNSNRAAWAGASAGAITGVKFFAFDNVNPTAITAGTITIYGTRALP